MQQTGFSDRHDFHTVHHRTCVIVVNIRSPAVSKCQVSSLHVIAELQESPFELTVIRIARYPHLDRELADTNQIFRRSHRKFFRILLFAELVSGEKPVQMHTAVFMTAPYGCGTVFIVIPFIYII